MTGATGAGQAALMDGIYRSQRHIYDLTRKYYLFGRDGMIEQLDAPADATVIEIACGTGRNLAAIARRWQGSAIHGLDISAEMLKSARTTLARALDVWTSAGGRPDRGALLPCLQRRCRRIRPGGCPPWIPAKR